MGKKEGTSRGKSGPRSVVDAPPDDSKIGLSLIRFVVRASVTIVILSYCAYLYDRDEFRSRTETFQALKPLEMFFDAVEKYSPFHEFLADEDQERKEFEAQALKLKRKMGDVKVFSPEELKAYDGGEGGEIYLALMGEVFDVTKGQEYYGRGGGYSFFAGRDAARAFVTGQFDDEGLTDDVLGLDVDVYHELEEWLRFYRKDYEPVGVLRGRYFDQRGRRTEYNYKVQELIAESNEVRERRRLESETFPGCNSQWSKETGNRVWCTEKSGGVDRTWAGVPRRMFAAGSKSERCACVKDFGEPNSHGSLDHPSLKEYPGCDPESFECQLSPPREASDEDQEL